MIDWDKPQAQLKTTVKGRSRTGDITTIFGIPPILFVLGFVGISFLFVGGIIGVVLILSDPVPTPTPVVTQPPGIAAPTVGGWPTAAPALVTSVPATLIPATAVPAVVGTPVDVTLSVNGFTRSTACVTAGQRVRVQASGRVTVGLFLGTVTPDGIENFVGTYDLVPGYRHGGLMCRIQGETQWDFCGDSRQFTAAQSGCLEFEVNDNDQSNNSGAFTVEVAAS